MPAETKKPVVRAEVWEADEYIITVDGRPVGGTLSKLSAPVVQGWLDGAIRELLATTKEPTNGK